MSKFARYGGVMKLGLASDLQDEFQNIEGLWNIFKDVVDQWLVVDSGSTDNTPWKLQHIVGDKLVLIHNDMVKTKGYSYARTKLIELSEGMDWVLIIDGDERMLLEEALKVRKLIDTDPPYDLIWIPRVSNWCWDRQMANYGGVNFGIGPNRRQALEHEPDWQPRLIRRTMIKDRSFVQFYRPVHELIQGLGGIPIRELRSLDNPVLDSFGRLKNPERKKMINDLCKDIWKRLGDGSDIQI